MKLFRENECFGCRLKRLSVGLFGTPYEKSEIEVKDLAYWKAKHERLEREAAAQREAERKEREEEKRQAKLDRDAERVHRALEKQRAAKQRKNHLARVAAAKKLVKEKNLRKVRRNGRTVYVNQNNDIVNYAILAYLLGNSNSSSHTSSYDYSSSSSSSSYDSSPSIDISSDFGGSFGGGDSGGGGASGSW